MLGLIQPVNIDYPVGYAAMNVYARSDSAVSGEALVLKKVALEFVENTEWSQVLFGVKSAALSQLFALAHDCSEPDWDGADANALSDLAITNVMNIIRALPDTIPIPEFTPEPDGSISLDWIESKHRIFTISVGSSLRLAYAWLDGNERGHGVVQFDGNIIPTRVIQGIRGIIQYDRVNVGSIIRCR